MARSAGRGQRKVERGRSFSRWDAFRQLRIPEPVQSGNRCFSSYLSASGASDCRQLHANWMERVVDEGQLHFVPTRMIRERRNCSIYGRLQIFPLSRLGSPPKQKIPAADYQRCTGNEPFEGQQRCKNRRQGIQHCALQPRSGEAA